MVDETALAQAVRRFATLRALAERAVREKRDDAKALFGAAGLFRQCGDFSSAFAALERAVAIAPAQSAIWFELGQTQKFLGRFDDAVRSYAQALQVGAGNYRARFALAQLRAPSPNELAELEREFDLPDEDGWRSLHHGHILAAARERAGDLPASFAWLERAKVKRRSLRPYDPVAEKALVDAIIAASPKLTEAEGEHVAPIFVVGLPRSGTTLVDRILSSHPNVTSAGELGNFPVLLNIMAGAAPNQRDAAVFRALGEVDFARLGALYLESARPLAGSSPRFVDKAPSNYLSVNAILRALPNARIVCVRRNPLDSVLSNYRQLFATEDRYYDYAYALESAAHKYVQFDRLAAHWRKIFPPERYMELNYEDLVARQEAVSRALLSFCGLEWDESCLAFYGNEAGVATPSALQVRTPMYTTSVGRWLAYGDLLDPARRVINHAYAAT